MHVIPEFGNRTTKMRGQGRPHRDGDLLEPRQRGAGARRRYLDRLDADRQRAREQECVQHRVGFAGVPHGFAARNVVQRREERAGMVVAAVSSARAAADRSRLSASRSRTISFGSAAVLCSHHTHLGANVALRRLKSAVVRVSLVFCATTGVRTKSKRRSRYRVPRRRDGKHAALH